MPGGRFTRSGAEFSPYGISPLLVPNFDIQQHALYGVPTIISGEDSDGEDEETIFTLTASQPTRPLHHPDLAPASSGRNAHSEYKHCTRLAKQITTQALSTLGFKSISLRRRRGALPLKAPLNTGQLPVEKTGWSGIRAPIVCRAYSLEELTGPVFGFTLVDWDGRITRPLVDSNGIVFAVLAGQPNDKTWLSDCTKFANKMADAAKDFCFTKKQKAGRHGDFRSASVGVSFGANTIAQEPQNLRQSSDANLQVLLTLLCLPELLRIAGFVNSIFKLYAPAVFGLYKETVDVLFLSNPSHIRNFPANFSTFTAATFNFGPNTITFPQIDALNLA
ncbi:hypothetical protein B0H13DRAFT_1855332 [Mycena leptocephala]|nr:hypothetical protein B0H13DRAFT_1855332 [Mycena leptocephala]